MGTKWSARLQGLGPDHPWHRTRQWHACDPSRPQPRTPPWADLHQLDRHPERGHRCVGHLLRRPRRHLVHDPARQQRRRRPRPVLHVDDGRSRARRRSRGVLRSASHRGQDDRSTHVVVASSFDGGETWVNRTVSNRPSFPRKVFFGDYNNIAAVDGHVRPIWTREVDGVLSVWTALLDLK